MRYWVWIGFLGWIHAALAQPATAVELVLTGRYDQHADYVTNFGGRAYNDTTRLYGSSQGISVSLRRPVTTRLAVSVGLGGYRLGVDQIRGSMPFGAPGVRTGRNMVYEDGMTNLLYSTSRYAYYHVSGALEVSYAVPLRSRLSLDLSATGLLHYTYMQRYLLMNETWLTTFSRKRPALGAQVSVGFQQVFGTFYLRPGLVLPVFSRLRGDGMFDEPAGLQLDQWFGGGGLILRIGRYLA